MRLRTILSVFYILAIRLLVLSILDQAGKVHDYFNYVGRWS